MDTSSLVFIDEAGVSTALSHNYGWAPPGETPVIERPARGKNITLIGAIGLDGVRAIRRVDGYVDGEVFIRFLKEDLGPALRPGDIVVMDGPRIHRVAGVSEALASFGATATYLPAYSPELNPIEMAWAWLKRLIRKSAPRRAERLKTAIQKYWETITPQLCQGWIRHCGYAAAST